MTNQDQYFKMAAQIAQMTNQDQYIKMAAKVAVCTIEALEEAGIPRKRAKFASELFKELMEHGFTREEAMQLLLKVNFVGQAP